MLAQQLAAFRHGFLTVAGGRVLSLVTPDDLKLLLCGVSELNFLQLKAGAFYEDYTGVKRLGRDWAGLTWGLVADHPTIQMFWNVVLSFDEEEKRLFLAFVTGKLAPIYVYVYLNCSSIAPLLRVGSRAHQWTGLHQALCPTQRP